MLDLGFLPDIERIIEHGPGEAADDAVLGDHAGRDRRAGPPLHDPADQRARRAARRVARRRRRPCSTSSGRTRWTSRRCWRGSCRPSGRGLTMVFCRTKRACDRGRRRPDRARFRRRARCTATSARASASGRCARSATARSTCWSPPTSPPAGSTSRTSPTSINYQCPDRRQDLRPPHRPHRPRGQGGRRGHVRRLGRHPALEADQQGARAWTSPTRRRPTPPPSTSTPTWTSPRARRARCRRAAATTAPGWTPRRSRTSARPAGPASHDRGRDRERPGPPARAASATGPGPARGRPVGRLRGSGASAKQTGERVTGGRVRHRAQRRRAAEGDTHGRRNAAGGGVDRGDPASPPRGGHRGARARSTREGGAGDRVPSFNREAIARSRGVGRGRVPLYAREPQRGVGTVGDQDGDTGVAQEPPHHRLGVHRPDHGGETGPAALPQHPHPGQPVVDGDHVGARLADQRQRREVVRDAALPRAAAHRQRVRTSGKVAFDVRERQSGRGW